MHAYLALPTLVGAWSMALGLRRHIEYHYSTINTYHCRPVVEAPNNKQNHMRIQRVEAEASLKMCISNNCCAGIVTLDPYMVYSTDTRVQ